MDNIQNLRRPLRTWREDDTITIMDAEGWHVATMESMGDHGEQQAEALCRAFNREA